MLNFSAERQGSANGFFGFSNIGLILALKKISSIEIELQNWECWKKWITNEILKLYCTYSWSGSCAFEVEMLDVS